MEPHHEPSPLEGEAAWGPGYLELSERLTARVARHRLSASAVDALASCAGRWAIEKLLPRSESPFGAAELGTATHQLFEDLFALPAEGRSTEDALGLLSELDALHGSKLTSPEDPAELDCWRQEVWRRAQGLWKIEDPGSVEVLGREVQLRTEVAGVPFVGFIDRVSVGPGGRVEVVDYKTGKPKDPKSRYGDPHGEQLRLYALAATAGASELVGGDPSALAARVFYVAAGTARAVELDDKSFEHTAARFRSAWETHNEIVAARRFPLRTSGLCGWCPAVEVCPAAAAAGKGPRCEQAFGGAELGIAAPGADSSVATDGVLVAAGAVEPAEAPSLSAPPLLVETPPSYLSRDEPQEDPIMPKHEGKPFDEVTPNTSELNPNSYAAMASFGLVGMAVEALHEASQPLAVRSIKALSRTFADLVGAVAAELGYRPSFQAGMHVRLRGTLHVCLRLAPPPFGDDAEAWETWTATTRRRMRVIAEAAFELWEGGAETGDEPAWAALATPKLSVVDGGEAGKHRR